MTDELLPYGTPIDLSNCEREPIHVPGHIQAHGALAVLDPSSLRVVQVSANLAGYVGHSDAEACVGLGVDELFAEPVAAAVRRAFEDDSALIDRPCLVHTGDPGGGATCDVIAHVREGYGIVELETAPARDAEAGVLERLRIALGHLRGPVDLQQFCSELASRVRTLTGYDRVMIYRFAPDWHGWVYAEAKLPELEPFLDLHYPASDIPAQARRLFLSNRVRLLPDARYDHVPLLPELLPDGRPLDMSHTFLRGASQMYTEYLVNMGVRGTLTLALPDGEQLWGMIACHHYGGPRRISHGERVACELLASHGAVRIRELIASERMRVERALDDRRESVVSRLAEGEDLLERLSSQAEALLGLWPASGFALFTSELIVTAGNPPSDALVRDVVAWLGRARRRGVIATDHLVADVPSASREAERAAGVLAVPVDYAEHVWLLWFRAEQIRSVTWAGDPNKPVETGPMGDRLTPRKSFELWQETVHQRSHPWTPSELGSADHLRQALGGTLYRDHTRLRQLASELERRNRELEHFARTASHDLREPLRAIQQYATFLEEDAGEMLTSESLGHLGRIRELAHRTRELIGALLRFSHLGREGSVAEKLDLEVVAGQVLRGLHQRIEARRARVSVGTLPVIHTWEVAVHEILANLVSNALKYSDGAPEIEIGWSTNSDEWPDDLPSRSVVIYVRDRGIGIPPAQHARVWNLYERLHRDGRYGDGTGIGLPIVRRLAEHLGGRVWLRSSPPNPGTTFYVALRDVGGPETTPSYRPRRGSDS